MKTAVAEVVRAVKGSASQLLDENITRGTAAVQTAIQERLAKMATVVEKSAEKALQNFVGVNEEEILTFIPDKRNFSGVGTLFLGLFFLVVLPGPWKLASLPFFLTGAVLLLIWYVLNSKVDVPDGYEGVVCEYGTPLTGEGDRPRRGRNWYFHFAKFIPFLVSKRDQVVDMQSANFTSDFASIALDEQIVFRVTDPAKFVANTSPAAIMKILNLYGSYTALRMITSMQDARVKFTGRDRLDNVVAALNRYLSNDYGVTVIRTNMPAADNEVLNDLEEIRTELKQIEAMKETKQVRLESAVKAVESQMRSNRKETRSRAIELQQMRITLETSIGEKVNTARQAQIISARRKLEELVSRLNKDVADLRARITRAKAIKESINGLETDINLRKAAIKRTILQKLMPSRIEVVNVEGMGAGIGLSFGNKLVSSLLFGKNGDIGNHAVSPAEDAAPAENTRD